MAEETKSFRVRKADKKPIPFNIELEVDDNVTGDDVHEGIRTLTFHAVPKLPGIVILDLVASGSLEGSYQAAALHQFFEEAVVDEDRERFFTTLKTARPAIDMEYLSEISNWLIEKYGEDRPTTSAAPS